MARGAQSFLSRAIGLLGRSAQLRSLARAVLPGRFEARLRDARNRGVRLVPTDELVRVYRNGLAYLVERGAGKPLGDYLEFGVFRGDSMLCMHRVLEEFDLRDVRLFGFDSFEGLPPALEDQELGWTPGAFRSDYEMTRRHLSEGGVDWDRTLLVKGWYEDTLTDQLRADHGMRRASVVMIDCDLHSSTRAALDFVAPLIEDDALVLFDDWDGGVGLADRNLGEKRAFEEFLQLHPELSAQEFDTYYHTEMSRPSAAKVFLVSRVEPLSE